MNILKTRLEDIASANTGEEVAMNVEHFQNQFIIHKDQMDELKHAIHGNLHQIAEQLVQTDDYASKSYVFENEDLYEKYLTEERLFSELRHEFNHFLAKWM